MSEKISRRGFIRTAAAASVTGSAGRAMADTSAGTVPTVGPGGFSSPWHRLPDRYWTGPDTWANPWEDWQLQKGKLVCIRPGFPTRTLHCLTHQLADQAGGAEIAVTVEYCGSKVTETGRRLVENIGSAPAKQAQGAVGFELGVRVEDPIDDYRSRLLWGWGLTVGMNGKGELFIGKEGRQGFPMLASVLGAGRAVRLICRLIPEEGGKSYAVEVEAVDAGKGGMSFGSLRKSGMGAGRLVGNIALVSNPAQPISGVQPTGLYAFSHWTVQGDRVAASPEQTFGPILWTLYTLSGRVMKMTAQMPPLGKDDQNTVELQLREGDDWKTVAEAPIDPLARTATFRIADWDDTADVAYRVRWRQNYTDGKSETYTWSGTVRRDPKDKPELVVGGYCCFMDYLFPNVAIAEQTRKVDPDIMFFVGDQIYEQVGGFGIIRTGDIERMVVNYLRKVALLGWSFRDVSRDRPTVWMPDDHDVYQGNVWGAGGRKITLEEWQSKTDYEGARCVGARGGYVQPADFVKAVERTQAAHLPDPYDPTPVLQGIGVYYTAMTYGRVSFAILEDRKFKSGPLSVYHHKSHRPDWIVDRQAGLDADVPEAELMGERQMKFLRDWVADWRGADTKIAVSQTILCNAATHHGQADHFLVADMDSNGWPQHGRNEALDVLRRGQAFMLAGDQHLPTVVRHGIKQQGDAGYSFCVPAGATGYQRWWRPEEIEGMAPTGGVRAGLPGTGQYRDGFGNLIDVRAVANPPMVRDAKTKLELGRQKSAGFGVVRVDKAGRKLTMQAWPVDVDPLAPDAQPYPGWPIEIAQADNDGRKPTAYLPTIRVEGLADPVVVVTEADSGELVSALRIKGTSYQPGVFGPGRYTVRVGEPGTERVKVLENLEAAQAQDEAVTVRFE